MVEKVKLTKAQQREKDEADFRANQQREWNAFVESYPHRLVAALHFMMSRSNQVEYIDEERALWFKSLWNMPKITTTVRKEFIDWDVMDTLNTIEKIQEDEIAARKELERKMKIRDEALAKLTKEEREVLFSMSRPEIE
jgi:hypothetical protein